MRVRAICISRQLSRRAGACSAPSFEEHWASRFGADWPALRASLSSPVEHVAWMSPWVASGSAFDADIWQTVEHQQSGAAFRMRRSRPSGEARVCPASFATPSGLHSHYALDGASPLPALALAPRAGHRVLDLCAAPGGKSLVLAGQLFGPRDAAAAASPSLLVANERSAARRARLRRALGSFLPPGLLREPAELLGRESALGLVQAGVAVTGTDAAQWGRGARWVGSFDRILADVPCSSERHVLLGAHGGGADGGGADGGGADGGGADGAHDGVQEWSATRLKRDARLQRTILANGARLLAVGGRLVYSTCSLCAEQNDGVVRGLLTSRKHGAGLQLVDALGVPPLDDPALRPLLEGARRTECGALATPDAGRFGPLYWAVLERTAENPKNAFRGSRVVPSARDPSPCA